MKPTHDSTRRQFLCNAGAALSAPIAVVAANAPAHAVEDTVVIKARLAMLEDLNAIRGLLREYAKAVSEGAQEEVASLFRDAQRPRPADVCGLTLDPFEDDAIHIEAGDAATAQVHCVLEIATPIESCPLVEMARAQGGGVAKRAERGVLETRYVKEQGAWKIKDLAFHSA